MLYLIVSLTNLQHFDAQGPHNMASVASPAPSATIFLCLSKVWHMDFFSIHSHGRTLTCLRSPVPCLPLLEYYVSGLSKNSFLWEDSS